MTPPTTHTTTYLLRSIDLKLWLQVKAQADADGLTMRGLIIALLRAYAAGRIVFDLRQL